MNLHRKQNVDKAAIIVIIIIMVRKGGISEVWYEPCSAADRHWLAYLPGDRLISVNSLSLEGVSYHAAVDILQNAPEDVTLVISQPKDKPLKGNAAQAPLQVPR